MAERPIGTIELQLLEEKRRTVGLTAAEKARWSILQNHRPSEQRPQSGFNVNAAAAELRASLDPAGLRNAADLPVPEPTGTAPEPAEDNLIDLDAELVDSPLQVTPDEIPNEVASPMWDAGPQVWDSSSPSTDDTSAQAWDPNLQPSDADAQPWDPSLQPSDADAQPWDPNLQPSDADAQPWDPNLQPSDADAQPWSPDAPGWEQATPVEKADVQVIDQAAEVQDVGTEPEDAGAVVSEPVAQSQDQTMQSWDAAAPAAEATAPSLEPKALFEDFYEPPPEPLPEMSLAADAEPALEDQPPFPESELPSSTTPGEAGEMGAWLSSPPPQVADLDDNLVTDPALGAGPVSDKPERPLPAEDSNLRAELELIDSAPAPVPAASQPLTDWPQELMLREDSHGARASSASRHFNLASTGSFTTELPSVDVSFDDETEETPAAAAPSPQVAPSSGGGERPVAGPGVDPIDLSEIATEDIQPEQILDGAAVLELLDAPLDAPAAVQPASHDPGRTSPAFVSGSHRVVVHTVEGLVKRGSLSNVDLDATEIALEAPTDGESEVLPTSSVKAIFFMLPASAVPAKPEGHKVRVTFEDGRQVAGYSQQDTSGTEHSGFFMVPADTRTNTERIWVYRAAIRQVTVD